MDQITGLCLMQKGTTRLILEPLSGATEEEADSCAHSFQDFLMPFMAR